MGSSPTRPTASSQVTALVPGRLEGLRATLDAAVTAAQTPPDEPAAWAEKQPAGRRLRLVT